MNKSCCVSKCKGLSTFFLFCLQTNLFIQVKSDEHQALFHYDPVLHLHITFTVLHVHTGSCQLQAVFHWAAEQLHRRLSALKKGNLTVLIEWGDNVPHSPSPPTFSSLAISHWRPSPYLRLAVPNSMTHISFSQWCNPWSYIHGKREGEEWYRPNKRGHFLPRVSLINKLWKDPWVWLLSWQLSPPLLMSHMCPVQQSYFLHCPDSIPVRHSVSAADSITVASMWQRLITEGESL